MDKEKFETAVKEIGTIVLLELFKRDIAPKDSFRVFTGMNIRLIIAMAEGLGINSSEALAIAGLDMLDMAGKIAETDNELSDALQQARDIMNGKEK